MKKLFRLIIFLLVISAFGICAVARLFPLEYKEIIVYYSEEYDVSPTLVAAIIKAESNWQTDAVSSAGAKGLMQLSDTTFEWIANEDDDIFDPKTNIKYGTFYFSKLYATYGDKDTALAAYNAGSGNVDKWLIDSRYSKDGKSIDSTPYGETNRYMRKINFYEKIYDLIYEF